ncbi:MAG: carboxymethylenebutenolidase [Gammaproteobacteria bacterium BRH_c0]|nr:MAG: carboxymethylenebutenolidase [Gammaproteobacteria bacterium BRH_c0]
MSIQTRIVEYSDGTTQFKGYLAWDDSINGPRPGVLIAHTWAGRSDHEGEKARKLAELGYVGFAIDMYGEGKLGTGVEECSAMMQPLLADRATLQQRINLALDTARQLPEVDTHRIAAMGFCFGGLCVLDLARSGADLQGVVSFHGLFTAPGNTEGNKISAKVLCLHGYDDPLVPAQSIIDLGDELTTAGADWQIHAYGGTVHAFTRPDANDPDFGAVYNPSADRRSWQSLLNFLAEIFA